MMVILKMISIAILSGSLVILITRRMFWHLTPKNSRSDIKQTPSFYQLEDPYLSGLVENLYENKSTLREN